MLYVSQPLPITHRGNYIKKPQILIKCASEVRKYINFETTIANLTFPTNKTCVPQKEAVVPHKEAVVPHKEAFVPHTEAFVPHKEAFAKFAKDFVPRHCVAIWPHFVIACFQMSVYLRTGETLGQSRKEAWRRWSRCIPALHPSLHLGCISSRLLVRSL